LIAIKNPDWPGYSVERCSVCGREWDIWQMFSRLSKFQSLLLETFCPKCTFRMLCDEFQMEAPPSSRKVWARKGGHMAKVKPELIGNRLEGEYLPAGVSQSGMKPHACKILDSELQEGEFGERYVLLFEPAIGQANLVSLNHTSLKRIVGKFGDETDDWPGKRIVIKKESVRGIRGAKVDAITVTPA